VSERPSLDVPALVRALAELDDEAISVLGAHLHELRRKRPAFDDLPERVTRQDLMALGFGQSAADVIFRNVPTITLPGLRRTYALREDVRAFLAEHTYSAGCTDRVVPPGSRR
jgi:hypothetical protein